MFATGVCARRYPGPIGHQIQDWASKLIHVGRRGPSVQRRVSDNASERVRTTENVQRFQAEIDVRAVDQMCSRRARRSRIRCGEFPPLTDFAERRLL